MGNSGGMWIVGLNDVGCFSSLSNSTILWSPVSIAGWGDEQVGQSFGEATFSQVYILLCSSSKISSGMYRSIELKKVPGEDHAPCFSSFPPSIFHCSTPASLGWDEEAFCVLWGEDDLASEREPQDGALGAGHPAWHSKGCSSVMATGELPAPLPHKTEG